MDSFFYNQSMYSNIEKPVPACFTTLEQHFGPSIPPDVRADDAPGVGEYVALAANLCRRMGDVEYYVKMITDELDRKYGSYTAKALSSLLVGYFSACKGVLDAGAIALAKIYVLGAKRRQGVLTNKEMDFARKGKNDFWSVLAGEQPTVHKRYTPFAGTFGNIIEWRDAAVHRIHPLVVTRMTRDPETNVHHIAGFDLALEDDPTFTKLWHQQKPWKWTDPLHFYRRWQPKLIEFCEEVCRDITSQSEKRLIVPDPVDVARINAALLTQAMKARRRP